MSSTISTLDSELAQIAEDFKKNVKVEDRTFRFTTYKDCFVGSEAVDYFIDSGQAPSRDDAVELGRALKAAHLFEHVTRDHDFNDDYLFYRFLDDKERGTFNVDETTGQSIEWSNFLMPSGGSSSSGRTGSSLLPQLPLADFEALNPNDIHVASRVWPLDEYNTTLLNHVHPPSCKYDISTLLVRLLL